MPKGKNVAVSFRVSLHFKLLLEAAAARERRSQTNMLEALLFAYCEERGIDAAPPGTTDNKAPAGGPSR